MACIEEKPKKGIIVSWSGGKDSALALSRMMDTDTTSFYVLLTMMIEDGSRSRSHGVKREVLEAQAKAIGLSIFFFSCSWDSYEDVFEQALRFFQGGTEGTVFKKTIFQSVVFGDICLHDDQNWNNHRTWADNMCARVGLESLQPLWGESEDTLIKDFFERGFKALIMCEKVDLPLLSDHSSLTQPQFLGKPFTQSLAKDFKNLGISPCGERGEFHTFVFDGSIFQKPLKVIINPEAIHKRSGYWHGDVVFG